MANESRVRAWWLKIIVKTPLLRTKRRLLLAMAFFLLSPESLAWQPRQLMEFTRETCRDWVNTGKPAQAGDIKPVEHSNIEVGGRQIGIRHRLRVDDRTDLELDVIGAIGSPVRFVSRLYRSDGRPTLLLSLNGDCGFQTARRINYNDNALALNIDSLDADFTAIGKPDWINPPLEKFDSRSEVLKKPDGGHKPLRVGMVDSGVNYRLIEINRHLARDSNNQLIGYDFWDMDDLPFDAHPIRSEFFLQRHGTRTASLLLREAPGIKLVPYRYPRPDMSRMQALVEHADRHQVQILGMPLGGDNLSEWQAFETAARDHPHMLFIVSAGNNGRNIDQEPIYPAAFDLENLLVVTSAGDFLRPAERTNWGRTSVDYLIPAEKMTVTDYTGEETLASGSSYAVARMVALAARIKMSNPDWKAKHIMAELARRYGSDESAQLARRWVSSGYIADPLAGNPIRKTFFPALALKPSKIDRGYRMDLNILVLGPRWTHASVERAVQTAFELLAQCDIASAKLEIHGLAGDDYLRDLSTGTARSLLEATASAGISVVFARDTRMQEAFGGEAFGLGNTRSRPWLANSVWLMEWVDDPGIALAHELFHVITNSGEHIEDAGNLMQSMTDPGSLKLSPAQCQVAKINGLANRLLHK